MQACGAERYPSFSGDLVKRNEKDASCSHVQIPQCRQLPNRSLERTPTPAPFGLPALADPRAPESTLLLITPKLSPSNGTILDKLQGRVHFTSSLVA
jgi:hypothetical protein